MLKLKALLAALVLASVAFAVPAQAATVVTNTTDQLLNAVGEATSTLTVAPFVNMTIFVSGTYSAQGWSANLRLNYYGEVAGGVPWHISSALVHDSLAAEARYHSGFAKRP